MTIAGRKGFHNRKNLDRKRIEDGKEVVIRGLWHRIYAKVAPEGDDVYIPVVEKDNGLTMFRFKNLTLEAKACRMIDLPGQKVSFMRHEPDKDITRHEDQNQALIKGALKKHFGRIGSDVIQVHIPIVEESGDKVPIRIQTFMCEEKGDK
ncbi:hypothetical protein ES703_19871 [subsurface metagenome]